MPFDDRDPKFERALAQHLRGGPAKANCPDAETLAAYHERNLSLEEMARWKEHISACEACQEALALVETTENQLAEDWDPQRVPVMEAASTAQPGNIPKLSPKAAASSAAQTADSPVAILRRRPALLRWSIPLGAVAAGVLVFIGIYEQRAAKVAHYSDTIVARRQEPVTPGPRLDQQQTKAQPEAELKDEQPSSLEMYAQKSVVEPAAGLTMKPKAEDKELDEELRRARDEFAVRGLEKKKLSPPVLARRLPTQTGKDATIPENAPVIAAAPPPPVPAPTANGGVVGGMGGGVAAQKAPVHADARSAPSAVTETVTVEAAAPTVDTSTSEVMRMKQGASNKLLELTAGSSGVILTPDNRVFWKLQAAGMVQLTTDGGKNWKSLETGANADLKAGFAPSSKVCWIAGKAGTLLLTKDRGNHWTRISTPIAGDLGGVHASDAKHASIWDADRHSSYETSDGGATWKPTTAK